MMLTDINTDALAPVNPPARRAGSHGDRLFASQRYDLAGNENPDFVLNQPKYRKCQILVAGSNFGCGSSRETAVWSLAQFGIRCVIAPSFGDIFFDNAFQNGLLLVRLAAADVQRIAKALEAANDPEITVDLESCTIETTGGLKFAFAVTPERRAALLAGESQLEMLQRHLPAAEAFERRAATRQPWLYGI